MQLPSTLWEDPQDLALVEATAQLFASEPLLLTDILTNTVFLNREAERFLGGRAEDLVNRVTASLLGFDTASQKLPARMIEALHGKGDPWKGFVGVPTAAGAVPSMVEASAIVRGGRLVCGVVRVKPAAVPAGR